MPQSVLKFEKGHKIPEKVNRSKYHFDEWEVGASFYTEEEHVVSAAYSWASKNEHTVTSRKQGDGWRVWRTS